MSKIPQPEGGMETALVPVVTPDQIDLIKRTVAAGATDDELKLHLYNCQRRGIHPLDGLLHFTKRGGKYVPVASIDLMRTRAAETGEYAGNDDPVFRGTFGEADFAATVTVWRIVQGQRYPFTATARWAEYYPGDNAGHMWRKMPHVMVAKVAEALALRKAFPQTLSGLYDSAEMDQAGQVETLPAATTNGAPDRELPPLAPSKATKGPRTITEKQQKRLFAIAKGAGWGMADIKRVVLKEAGVEHTADIKVGKYPGEYDALCKVLEAGPDAYGAGAGDADEDFGADAADGTEDNPF